MLEVSSEQRCRRMSADNPWWEGSPMRNDYAAMKPRAYFSRFTELVSPRDARRAVVLMGPRRVGKTVMLHHLVGEFLRKNSLPARNVAYLSLDQPLYTGMAIEQLANEIWQVSQAEPGDRLLILDEIQYLKNWEQHLKVFVDSHPETVCVASGSAAAALRMKSIESGAGRFTDFLLPPLTFYEYLDFLDKANLVEIEPDGAYSAPDIEALNKEFVDYCNFGGFPEAALSETVRQDPHRYLGADIVEKVLLRDLPSLYGIQNVQELNSLFSVLAYNTGQEVSLERLSQSSGVSKPTIRRYLDYLQAAFLVRIVHRIDRNARRFQRATRFKVYLTAPALRSALFEPVEADHPDMGAIAETAVFAQWFHSDVNLRYARWSKGRLIQGEVDIVCLDARQDPGWCVEVKWSDRVTEHRNELKSLASFSQRHPQAKLVVTTRNHLESNFDWGQGARLDLLPTSLYCLGVGHRAIHRPTDDAPFFAF